MKAVVQDTYGSPDVLELQEIDKPVAGDDDLLVRVRAAGVDPGVWHLMTGLPYLVRVMGYGLRKPKVGIRGRDVAGRVEAIGTDVTRFRPGDEVFGICDGSFAEYVCAQPAKLVYLAGVPARGTPGPPWVGDRPAGPAWLTMTPATPASTTTAKPVRR